MSLEAQVATDPSGAALPPAPAVDPERFSVLVLYSQSKADVGLRPRAVDAIIFKAGGCVVQQPKPATPTIVILEILPNDGRLADWPTLGVNCEMSRHRRGVDEPTLCIEDYILEYGVEVNQYGQVVSNYTSLMGTPPVRLTTWPHFLKWLADKRTPFPTIGRFVRTDLPIVDKSASSSGSRATVDAADEQAAVERRLTDATGMYAAFGGAGAVQGNAVWRSAQQFKQVLMASNVVNTAGYSGLMLTFNLSKEVSAMVELADLDITYSLDFASIIVFAGQVDRLTGKWRCSAKDKPIQDALYRSSLTSGALVLPENWLLGCIIDGVLHDPRKSRLLLHVSNAGDPFCDTTPIELWQELPMEPIDDH